MLKKGNTTYIAFLVICIPLFIFFLSSKFIFERQKKSLSELYQQTVSLNDYLIKLDNATYNTDTKELKVTAFIKQSTENGSTKPEIYSISPNYDLESFLTYRTERNPYNDFGIDIIIENLNDDYRYVRIFFQSKLADRIIPESYDEFGNLIPEGLEKGEMQYCHMIIDRLDCTIINNETPATEPPKTSVLFDEDNIQSESQAAENMPQVITTAPNDDATDKDNESKSSDKDVVVDDIPDDKTTTKESKTVKITEGTKTEGGGFAPNTSPNDDYSVSDYQPSQIEKTTTQMTTTSITRATERATARTTKATTRATTTTKSTTKSTSKSTTKATTRATTKATTKATTTQGQSIPLTRLYINSDYSGGVIRLNVGESAIVSAGYEPTYSDAVFTWSSNRTDRATVDSNGMITAVGTGSAIITVTSSDGLSASIMVTVS